MTIANTNSQRGSGWEVQAHDVGQANTYSITTSNKNIMIDVGDNQSISALDTHDSRTIDHLITTHIHDDHVAGLRYLRDEEYSVVQAYRPNANRSEVGNETGYVNPIVLEEYFENLSELGIEFDETDPVSTGDDILEEETEESSLCVLSPPATSDVLKPTSQETGYQCDFKPERANPNGVVCKFEGPDSVSGLFMGDVGDEGAHYAESWLLEQHEDPESGIDLNAAVLFIGHHGSKHSTGTRFIEAVDPDHVVISSSLANDCMTSKNQYDGHPHDETLERLHEQDVAVHWTAVHGTIRITVEDGTIRIEHTNAIETTVAGDLAALKYYARANDLGQNQLAGIKAIAVADLPEEVPDWIEEADIVTVPSRAIEKTDGQKDQIDVLHALEVEHRSLTKRKNRLEREHERLTEEKNDLEEERETTSGLWDRFTAAVGRSATDTEPNTETAQDDTTTVETDPNDDQPDTTDTDSKPYQETDDIDEAIEILERDNTALETAVETLTQTTETLQTDIEQIEQQLAAPSGLTERLSNMVVSLNGTEPDEYPRVIRQPRFNGVMASAAGKTDTKATAHTNTPAEEQLPDRYQTSTDRSTRNPLQNLMNKKENATAEPKQTDTRQDKNDDDEQNQNENRNEDHPIDAGL
jgi:beta-lactamase superfamily II metal-dependent hydrolase